MLKAFCGSQLLGSLIFRFVISSYMQTFKVLTHFVLVGFWIVFFCFCRGVSINVLRHEAELYGITPLGNFFFLM